jgi:hypothetical protein
MVSLWITIGLILATICVSVLGAGFSIVGLAALFSGAALAVAAMAGSLEFAKFVLAAYLHQRWNNINLIFKTYLTSAIAILSIVTSMGIFGFLSNAYQSASTVLEGETIRINSLKNQLATNKSEIVRMTNFINEIPVNRVTKRIQARAEQEPLIAELNKKNVELEKQITDADLKILDVKQKVGPLIYISRAFAMDIDTVVKYLIFTFVLVFDPLAICLVIASTGAIESRRHGKKAEPETEPKPQPLADNQISPLRKVIKMRFSDSIKKESG